MTVRPLDVVIELSFLPLWEYGRLYFSNFQGDVGWPVSKFARKYLVNRASPRGPWPLADAVRSRLRRSLSDHGAVASGDVDASFVAYPSAKGLIDGGKLRVLAVTSATRLKIIPDVPTMVELGYKSFVHTAFVGLSAPQGTPTAVIAKLNGGAEQVDRLGRISQPYRAARDDVATAA